MTGVGLVMKREARIALLGILCFALASATLVQKAAAITLDSGPTLQGPHDDPGTCNGAEIGVTVTVTGEVADPPSNTQDSYFLQTVDAQGIELGLSWTSGVLPTETDSPTILTFINIPPDPTQRRRPFTVRVREATGDQSSTPGAILGSLTYDPVDDAGIASCSAVPTGTVPPDAEVVERTTQLRAAFGLNRGNAIAASTPGLIEFLDRTDSAGPLGNLAFSADDDAMGLVFATSLSKINREREKASARTDNASGSYGYSGGTLDASRIDRRVSMAASPPHNSTTQRQFDVWTEIRGSRSTTAGADSSFWIGYVGAHWFASEDMIIGGLVQFDWAEEDYESSAATADGFGWMAGPYIAGRLPGTSLSYEGRVAWGQADNSISPDGTYEDDYDSSRWFATGKVEGSYQFNGVTVSPSVRVSYFRETLDGYIDSLSNEIPEQTVSFGEVRFGPSFSKAVQLGNGSIFTPTVGIAGVWNFDIEDNASNGPNPLGDDRLRAMVNAGFSLANTRDWVFSASGYYDGLGIDDYEAYGGRVRLTIPMR